MDAIRRIPNRSEFIRSAVVAALGAVCPLCNGTGVLTHNQKRHWDEFSESHHFERCEACHERFLKCRNAGS
jgi:hypothetical protein